MKIGSTEIKPAQAPPAASTGKDRPAAAAGSPAAAEPSAKVELSTAAPVGGSDPTFDTAKVDRIAQAIRDGKFEVNAEAIADKLIVNAAELLGRKPS